VRQAGGFRGVPTRLACSRLLRHPQLARRAIWLLAVGCGRPCASRGVARGRTDTRKRMQPPPPTAYCCRTPLLRIVQAHTRQPPHLAQSRAHHCSIPSIIQPSIIHSACAALYEQCIDVVCVRMAGRRAALYAARRLAFIGAPPWDAASRGPTYIRTYGRVV
jgi:hypothetical protein